MKAQNFKLALLGLAIGALSVNPAQAATIDVEELITNGTFDKDFATGWAASDATNVNIRVQNNQINAAGSGGDQKNVFDSDDSRYFTTGRFAVLGDQAGNITNTGTTNGVSNSISTGAFTLSQTIVLAAIYGSKAVQSYDLTLSFKSAFDGSDSDEHASDTFTATLSGPGAFGTQTLFSQTSFTPTPGTGSQQDNVPYSQLFSGLLPGEYILAFSLVESASEKTNTAAGIDDLSFSGTATVVPVPGAVWLLGSALAGISIIGRRKQRGELA